MSSLYSRDPDVEPVRIEPLGRRRGGIDFGPVTKPGQATPGAPRIPDPEPTYDDFLGHAPTVEDASGETG